MSWKWEFKGNMEDDEPKLEWGFEATGE